MTTPNEELRKQLQQIYKSGELYYRVISDAADLLQSQAERIATLEGDVEYLQEDINAMCNAIPDYRWSGGAAELIAKCFAERDTLRAELADAELHTEQVERGLDKATAQLAEIEKTEPVSLATDQTDEFGEVIYREVFPRPMPAQDVTELVGALQLFAYALPLDKSTAKTCYAVNNQMRDAAHAALSKYKGAK